MQPTSRQAAWNRPFLLALLAGLPFPGLVAGSSPNADEFPPAIVSWVPDPAEPVFEDAPANQWDDRIRERGWILTENGTMHLFYTGYSERSPLRMLGHATSKDGIHWMRDPGNPLHATSWVEDFCIIQRDGVYLMFAEGQDDIAHLLKSKDLKSWKDEGPLDIRTTAGEPISPGPRGTPFVLVEGGVWYLFYERGDRGVWLATSSDGKIWTNKSDDPVLRMGPEEYDRTAVAVNQIVKRDGFYYAFYHANAHEPWRDWTTCVARSRDLVHWEKYPGNPIIKGDESSAILVDGLDGRRYLYVMHPYVKRYSNPPAAREPGPDPAPVTSQPPH